MGSITLLRSRTIDAVPSRSRSSLTDVERLTAAWIALALILVGSRFYILYLAGKAQPSGVMLIPWLPLAIYQDMGFVFALGMLSNVALNRISSPRSRLVLRAVAWMLCVIAAWYSIASVEIFRFLSTPLTYRLIAMSHNLRGIQASMESALTHQRIALVTSAPLILLALAYALLRYGANLVRAVREVGKKRSVRLAVVSYFFVAWGVTRAAELETAALANPHWTLAASLWDREDPFVTGTFAESDLDDFRPRGGHSHSEWRGKAKGLNVLMLVMESVGAEPLSHYGSSHPTTPELSKLAERGLTFHRIYSSQPYTSNAMVSIFCSLYPWHGWRSVPRRDPNVRVSGVGNVLQAAGYRTAMLHTGDMKFDNEKRFLELHGFGEVHDVWSLQSVLGGDYPGADTPQETRGMHLHLPDDLLLPATTRWIDADRSRPFFLALWTIQTHHPYFSGANDVQFDSRDAELNRYLNAIRVTDRLLGDVVRELKRRDLDTSTLIIVLGDHGEAFGQHAHRGHSKTLYEEELRVPLVMAAPHWIHHAQNFDMLGQQIDIAPTILDLLGLDTPPEWQGQSLFAPNRTERAYFFTAFYHYMFGMIDGHRKYVWNASTGKAQYFDLLSDPGEKVDLMGVESSHRPAELHRRLASWVYFQNQYLGQFIAH
jgi:arylsulfatase A-like enzyme